VTDDKRQLNWIVEPFSTSGSGIEINFRTNRPDHQKESGVEPPHSKSAVKRANQNEISSRSGGGALRAYWLFYFTPSV